MPDNEADEPDALPDTYEGLAIAAHLRGELALRDLCCSLSLERSATYKRIARYREAGEAGLLSRRRGNRSRAYSEEFKSKVIQIVTERYSDFSAVLASEKLLEVHGIKIGEETLRKWMKEAGLKVGRASRTARIFQLREPRPCRGELIQIDGSYHRWFEKRGPEACLIVFIDDATSELMLLRFVDHEGAYNYMSMLKEYVERYGIPEALFSDRHSTFRSSKPSNSGLRLPTKFTAAAHQLGIQVICAETPQAKGRVERANRTLQDRLVKEMRLLNISTIDQGNSYLESYRREHNHDFARQPASSVDVHRPAAGLNLDNLLTYAVERKVTKSLAVHFNKIRYILEDTLESRWAIGQRVSVVVYLNGTVEIVHGETTLPYRTFDKIRRVSAGPLVVDSKRLSTALAFGKLIQEVEPHHYKRSAHVMAGFRKHFKDPDDAKSVALQNAPTELRKRHNGRPRAPLGRHPIVILAEDAKAQIALYERQGTGSDSSDDSEADFSVREHRTPSN